MVDYVWLVFFLVGFSEWLFLFGLMVIRNLLIVIDEVGDIVFRYYSFIYFFSFFLFNVCIMLDVIRIFKLNMFIGVFRCFLNIVIVRDL